MRDVSAVVGVLVNLDAFFATSTLFLVGFCLLSHSYSCFLHKLLNEFDKKVCSSLSLQLKSMLEKSSSSSAVIRMIHESFFIVTSDSLAFCSTSRLEEREREYLVFSLLTHIHTLTQLPTPADNFRACMSLTALLCYSLDFRFFFAAVEHATGHRSLACHTV